MNFCFYFFHSLCTRAIIVLNSTCQSNRCTWLTCRYSQLSLTNMFYNMFFFKRTQLFVKVILILNNKFQKKNDTNLK